MQAALAATTAEPGAPGPQLPASLAKPLLRRLDDASAKCRELAAACVLRLLRGRPDASLELLPYVMPVLEERMERRVGGMSGHAHVGARACAACAHIYGPTTDHPTIQPAGPVEPSEEVRLMLTQMLTAMIGQV